ncbi:carbohydrate ABC transporter permease [Cohnella abietis]|uniref:Sugar ABC transporter permease n=1 Tax=Cohnella abietis TaxID=2507935 RepID=A0A3T1DEL6_9BACL|nr:carbohydrate ABC transporter permease [Cohnella abietis]BBI36557.1 sugar ABC transporter permease [Cohnella abietis]
MLLKLLKWLLLIGFALVVLIPLMLVVFTAFKSTPQFYANPIGFPTKLFTGNFRTLFEEQPIWRYARNSVLVTVSTVFFELLLASMIAYGIIRSGRVFGKGMYALFAVGLMIPSQVSIIPIYSLLHKLGWTNSIAGLVAVTVSVLMPLSVFMLGGFMRTLPKEIMEAGSIDGLGEWGILLRIALPLSAPYLAATSAFLFVIVWNDLLFPMLLVNTKEKMTLPIAMLQFRGEFVANYPMLMTGVLVTSIPMIVLYVFLQRFFISGALAGSLKG